MSQQLISLSPDLARLRDEGYEVEISDSNYLLIHNVPYVNAQKKVVRATLASELTLIGNQRAGKPHNHVALFTGEQPCHRDGTAIAAIVHAASNEMIADNLRAQRSFSNKPPDGYPDYYAKMTRYIAIISHPARSLDPSATAQTYKVLQTADADSPFAYPDTFSSRYGLVPLSNKLKLNKVAIVGLGGTGSYVLDLVAKTPVKEIHLFDQDRFHAHNAFRAPGAAPLEELNKGPLKADYFAEVYRRIHRGVISHATAVGEDNADQLLGSDFVFICVDKGSVKAPIVARLESANIPFVDVGMGLELVSEAEGLVGVMRVTTSTAAKREHFGQRVSFVDVDDDEYRRNIQIADLNALNAALAVIKWKKHFGFYQDIKQEHHSAYSLNVNSMVSADFHETQEA